MTEPIILLEHRGPVALLTLNRPDVLNALSAEVLGALGERVREVREAGGVRALVVTGAGRAFAAGADISQMRDFSALEAQAFSRLGHETFAALESLSIPTIAAVNGFALGGGCELALACDWIYAAQRARFGQPEVKLGLIPGFGGTSRLARSVGPAWAKELNLSGEPIDAETAQRIGLANRLFEDGDATVAAACAVGEAVAGTGSLAVARAKRVMQEGQSADVRVAHVLEQEAFGSLFATGDAKEGMGAFVEKRDPAFRGS